MYYPRVAKRFSDDTTDNPVQQKGGQQQSKRQVLKRGDDQQAPQQQQSHHKAQQQQQQQQQGLLPSGRPSAYASMLARLAKETQPRVKTAQQQKDDEEYFAACDRPTIIVDEAFFNAQDEYWAAINKERLAAAAARDAELALMEPLPTNASELMFGSIASLDCMAFA